MGDSYEWLKKQTDDTLLLIRRNLDLTTQITALDDFLDEWKEALDAAADEALARVRKDGTSGDALDDLINTIRSLTENRDTVKGGSGGKEKAND